MHLSLVAVCLMASALIMPAQSVPQSFTAGGVVSWDYETCHWFWELLGWCKPGSRNHIPSAPSTDHSSETHKSNEGSPKPGYSRPSSSYSGTISRKVVSKPFPEGFEEFMSCKKLESITSLIKMAQLAQGCNED